jgi:hypothetical protein
LIRKVPRHIAIWIDAHQAILLISEAEPFGQSTLHRPGEGWSQGRVDAQQYPSAQQYYGAVLAHLEPLDEILILGPGQARLELRHQIGQQAGLKGKVVGLQYASMLAKAEVIFPTREAWRLDEAGEAQVDRPIRRPVPSLGGRLRGQR